ncbi:MAG: hypothetical protein JWN70_4065 [Planctomycetaceae bacterium]|nr:hypothetical protein [Planctomycetaceae bacterium]
MMRVPDPDGHFGTAARQDIAILQKSLSDSLAIDEGAVA